MGPLIDITARVNNSPYPVRSDPQPVTPKQEVKTGYDRRPLSDKSNKTSNVKRSASPRFMSPTASSIQSQTTPSSKKENVRISTPTFAASNGAKSRNWVASAAKRVGIGKSGESTPRSQKQAANAKEATIMTLTPPDNIKTSPYSSLNSAEKALLRDKPLPSPPVATFVGRDSAISSRTLLDASEISHSDSPPDDRMAGIENEWPALSPEKLAGSKGLEITSPNIPQQKTMNEGTATRLPSHSTSRTAVHETGSPSLTRKPVPKHAAALPDMSASASTMEKTSGEKPTNFSLPRQTKTSSLRARLSAGAVSAETVSTGKTVGFTDSPSVKEIKEPESRPNASTKGAKLSSRPTSGHARRSPSKTTVRFQGRAPAKMVAGSRRPEFHRPSSRSSIRERGSQSSCHPGNNADQDPLLTETGEESQQTKPVGTNEPRPLSETRRSSIPVFRPASTSKSHVSENEGDGLREKGRIEQDSPSLPRDDSNVFKDPTPRLAIETIETNDSVHQTVVEGNNGVPTTLMNNPPQNSRNFGEDGSTSGSGKTPEDSATYRMKRLSKNYPEHGPTLKISSEADCILLGVDCPEDYGTDLPRAAKKGNNAGKKDSSLLRKVVKNEFSKSKDVETKHTDINVERPHSLEAEAGGPTGEEANKEGVQQEALSADVETLKSISEEKDPFVDEQSLPKGRDQALKILESNSKEVCSDSNSEANETTKQQVDQHIARGDEGVPADHAFSAPTQVVKSVTQCTTSTVAEVGHQLSDVENHTITEAYPTNSVSSNTTTNQAGHNPRSSHDKPGLVNTPLHQKKDSNERKFPGQLHRPSTPVKQRKVTPYPPRTSSRTPISEPAVPKKRPSPPIATRDPAALRASKDFPGIQNNLGSAKGFASTQVEIEHEGKKRASQSTKGSSQGPYAKSMLSMSNLKGLFRRSPAEAKQEGTSTNKGAKGSTKSRGGSPFPLQSDPWDGTNKKKGHQPTSKGSGHSSTPGFLDLSSPTTDEMSQASSTAMHILESARNELDTPKKERLLEIGKMMVDAITYAREAEKAKEEAKVAADKAEMSFMLTRKKVLDVTRFVEEWADLEIDRNSKRSTK
ncbi:MAG: hypothetical protein M1837_000693 [Sclerophora amabilis]|nr:MAG: hypothetical protein M1837_000693 [Sclerophora amabilis]